MSRAAIATLACVGLVAGIYGLSRLVMDDDQPEGLASRSLALLPRAPVSVPPPTRVRDIEERLRESPEAEEGRAPQLPFKPRGAFGAGTPARALASFMAAWRDRHWSRMVTWTAAAWSEFAPRPAEQLAHRFGGRRPHGYLILSRLRSEAEVRYRVLVEHRALRPRLLRETIALRLLHSQIPRRGTAPGLRWGVDPTSVRVVAEHAGAP